MNNLNFPYTAVYRPKRKYSLESTSCTYYQLSELKEYLGLTARQFGPILADIYLGSTKLYTLEVKPQPLYSNVGDNQ